MMFVIPFSIAPIVLKVFSALIFASSPRSNPNKLPIWSFALSLNDLPAIVPSSPNLPFALSISCGLIPPSPITGSILTGISPASSISCSICGIKAFIFSDNS